MDDASTTGPDASQLTRDGWLPNGGFSSFMPKGRRWATYHLVDAAGKLTSSHVFMMDEFVHYFDDMGTCTCGPHVAIYQNPMFGPVSMVTHNEWDGLDSDPDDDDDPEIDFEFLGE